MILLKRLRVHALKQLRDVEIWFPRRGSLLIEGHNEAGKSTLFEAVYFAIYGAALVGEETKATLEDLIPHGGTSADVELTLVAGQTELDIRRTVSFARGRAQVGQQARVIVRRPGMPLEEIHGPRPVNTRILHELHELNGETLRNSCFMEQKALERLEALSRGQREVAIARLLGLDHLQQVAHTLESECADLRRQVEIRRGELEVATWQRGERDAAERTRQWEQRAAAVEALELIARRDAVEDTVVGKSTRIAALREEMRGAERRIWHAEEVLRLLEAVRATQEQLQEALAQEQRHARLVEEADALERLERDEAAPLERRLAQLGALADDLAQCEEMTAQVDALRELTEAAAERAALQQDQEVARRALDDAEARAARHTVRASLQEWARLTERETLLTDGGAERERLARAHDNTLRTLRLVERRARVALAAVIGPLMAGLLAGVAGLAWHPLWGVAGVALLCAIGACVWQSGVRRGLPAAKSAAAAATEALTRLEARAEMARGLPGSREDLARVETALRRAGVTPPSTLDEARARLAALPEDAATNAASTSVDLEAARRALTQRETQYDAASERFNALSSQHATLLGAAPLAGALDKSLHERRATRDALNTRCAEQAVAAGVAPETSAVMVAQGTAKVRLRDLRERLAERERLREDMLEAATALRAATNEVAARLAEQVSQARALDIEAVPLSEGANDLDLLSLTWKTLHATLATAYMRLGETSERERLAALGSRVEEVDRGARETGLDRAGAIQALRDALAGRGVECAGDETLAELRGLWPALAEAEADDPGAVERELLAARNDAYHARESAARAAKARNLEGITLDEHTCRAEVEAVEAALRRRMTAARMAFEAQARIFRRVIPETALHMRALLPALTDGRYRDVELIAENESAGGADLKIRVWDQMAGRFVAKNLFSGGTRDQCSLALRLAFALATLPKEVGATPGFVFLDEPLSSFDGERSRALIEVLTHGAIAEQFAQVMLVSHSRSFDQRSFRFRLRMAGGRIVETNLPDEREAERLWVVESAIVESTGA